MWDGTCSKEDKGTHKNPLTTKAITGATGNSEKGKQETLSNGKGKTGKMDNWSMENGKKENGKRETGKQKGNRKTTNMKTHIH